MAVHSIGTSDCDSDRLSATTVLTAITLNGPVYQFGADNLWHKYETDSDGLWGEITAPQAGAPPF